MEKKKVLAPEDHALLGASSASRWLACTPSAFLSKDEPKSTSVYADEGTRAHEAAAKVLAGDSDSGEYEIAAYVNYIKENQKVAHNLLIEQRVDFSEWVPGGFGTSDAVLVYDDMLEIVDLKYGKGIQVSAYNNPQLRLYALGTIKLLESIYEFKRIKMTIVQPRLDNISSDEMDVKDLVEWADTYVKPRAELAAEGAGELVSGDHCKFCPILAKCPKHLNELKAVEPIAGQSPELISIETIAKILPNVTKLETWLKSLKSYALEELQKGHEVPGYKLVAGKADRVYTDTLKIAETLKNAGYAEAVIYERSLLGLGKMEKLLGKKDFEKLVGAYVARPQGKPTLVPISDKRPAIKTGDDKDVIAAIADDE